MGNTAAIVNYAEGIHDPRDDVALKLFERSVKAQGADPLALAKKVRDLILALHQMSLPPVASANP